MSRYRKIDVRMWSDEKFLNLGPLEKLCWTYLLTGPQTNQIGLYRLSKEEMAHNLEVKVEEVRRILLLLMDAGMIRFDEAESLLWLPRWIEYNAPIGTNQAISYVAAALDFMPHRYAKALRFVVLGLIQSMPEEVPKHPETKRCLTPQQAVIIRDGVRCAYCAEIFIKPADVQVHCVIPSTKGENFADLVSSCQKCHTKKGEKTAQEFGFPFVAGRGYSIHKAMERLLFEPDIRRAFKSLYSGLPIQFNGIEEVSALLVETVPARRRLGSVETPFERRSNAVPTPFERRSDAVETPFRRRTNAVRAPFVQEQEQEQEQDKEPKTLIPENSKKPALVDNSVDNPVQKRKVLFPANPAGNEFFKMNQKIKRQETPKPPPNDRNRAKQGLEIGKEGSDSPPHPKIKPVGRENWQTFVALFVGILAEGGFFPAEGGSIDNLTLGKMRDAYDHPLGPSESLALLTLWFKPGKPWSEDSKKAAYSLKLFDTNITRGRLQDDEERADLIRQYRQAMCDPVSDITNRLSPRARALLRDLTSKSEKRQEV